MYINIHTLHACIYVETTERQNDKVTRAVVTMETFGGSYTFHVQVQDHDGDRVSHPWPDINLAVCL